MSSLYPGHLTLSKSRFCVVLSFLSFLDFLSYLRSNLSLLLPYLLPCLLSEWSETAKPPELSRMAWSRLEDLIFLSRLRSYPLLCVPLLWNADIPHVLLEDSLVVFMLFKSLELLILGFETSNCSIVSLMGLIWNYKDEDLNKIVKLTLSILTI